jgi:hypothetical protein
MIFYYAVGGGFGHLTRARAVLHTLGLTERVTILTASPWASDKRIVGESTIIKIPQDFLSDIERYRNWLYEIFEKSRPTKIFLDCFPCGLAGEFCRFDFPKSAALFHSARGLRWAEYEKVINGTTPIFSATYVIEPLATEQESYLQLHSEEIAWLNLIDPPPRLSDKENDFVQTLRENFCLPPRPCWLVIHSGSPEEVAELLAYAREMSEQERINPRIILIAPEKMELSKLETRNGLQTPDSGFQTAVEQVDFYPASALLPFADRIITACGFNMMRQTERYRDKHRFLPFARRFDNQFLRAARRRADK